MARLRCVCSMWRRWIDGCLEWSTLHLAAWETNQLAPLLWMLAQDYLQARYEQNYGIFEQSWRLTTPLPPRLARCPLADLGVPKLLELRDRLWDPSSSTIHDLIIQEWRVASLTRWITPNARLF
jgi:hypothetical protein